MFDTVPEILFDNNVMVVDMGLDDSKPKPVTKVVGHFAPNSGFIDSGKS